MLFSRVCKGLSPLTAKIEKDGSYNYSTGFKSKEMSYSHGALLPFPGLQDPVFVHRMFLCSPAGVQCFQNMMRGCVVREDGVFDSSVVIPMPIPDVSIRSPSTATQANVSRDPDGVSEKRDVRRRDPDDEARDAQEYSDWVKRSGRVPRLRPL
jgi:hypothetical protein